MRRWKQKQCGLNLSVDLRICLSKKEKKKHEVCFVFQVDIDIVEVAAKEDHISFYWFTMDEFINENIVPAALKDAIVAWTAEKEVFFIEEKKGN